LTNMDYSLVQNFDGKQDSTCVSRTDLCLMQGGNRESERLKISIPISIGFVNYQLWIISKRVDPIEEPRSKPRGMRSLLRFSHQLMSLPIGMNTIILK